MASANPVLDLISQQTQIGIQQSKDLLQSNMDLVRKSEQLSANVGKIYEDVANAQHLVSLTEGLGKLQTQKAIQRDAHAAGLDPTAQADELSTALKDTRTNEAQVSALMDEWKSNQTLRIWEDPAQWVKNRFNEGNLRGTLEQTAAKADFNNKKVLNISARMEAATRTERNISSTITQASIEAQATIAASEANIAAQKAAFEGFAANTRGVKFAMDATSEQLGFLYNVENAKRQATQTDIALKHLSLAQSHEARIADAAKESKSVDDYTADNIRQGMLNYGFSIEGVDNRAIKNMVSLFKSGGEGGKDAYKFYESGRLTKSSGGKPMIAATPAEAAHGLDSGHNLPPGREGATEILRRAVKAASNPAAGVDAKKDPVKYNAFINEFVRDEVKRVSTDIQVGSPQESPRFIGDLKSYLGTAEIPGISDLVNLPISQKVFLPAIKAGVALTDPGKIRAMGTDAVLKQVITSSEYSSGLAQIFQKANELHQQSNDFLGVGIQLPNAGKDYLVRNPYGSRSINQASAVDLGTILAQDLARYLGPPGQGGRRGGSPGEIRRTLNSSD